MYTHNLPTRRPARRPQWDYRSPAAYFITIVTNPRRPLFGTFGRQGLTLSIAGQIAFETWVRGDTITPNIVTLPEESIVMPDHTHAILWILDPDEPDMRDPETLYRRSLQRMGSSDYPSNRQRSVGAIVGSYKSATSRQIHELGLSTESDIWQRGYHDRIIRDTRSLDAIRAYIRNNPIRARERGRWT